MLYLFFEKYNKSLLKPLRSFAEGLKRDIDAVENAVAYDYSNIVFIFSLTADFVF